MKSILVTGSNGLLGQKVVEALLNRDYYITGVSRQKQSKVKNDKFQYISLDLTNVLEVEKLFNENEFTHVIHLAAIAHAIKGINISWSSYYRVNTLMSRQIFECASSKNIPVFFSSTVDVYGIQNDKVDENTIPKPVGFYAKSKYLAENHLIELAKQPYLIVRLAPIYTQENKKDIRKRYYIKYPKICYLIGDGIEYEFLSVDKAVHFIVNWVVNYETMSGIINVCDDERVNTKLLVKQEKNRNKIKIIIIPKCLAKAMEIFIRKFTNINSFFVFKALKILSPIQIVKRQINM